MDLLSLLKIAAAGSNIKLDASKYNPLDLLQIANAIKPNAKLYLKNAEKCDLLTLLQIANAKKSQIIFEF